MSEEDQIPVIEPRPCVDPKPCAIGGMEIIQVVVAILTRIDLSMASAHKTVFVKHDIPLFTAKVGAGFGQTINILRNVADTDLNKFEVPTARR